MIEKNSKLSELIKKKMTEKPSSITQKYLKLLGADEISKIRDKSEKFRENKVFHVNATKFGGGVAEILNNMIPLMHEFNIDAQWEAFTAPDEFFNVSKKMHNSLQGNRELHFSEEEIQIYKKQAKSIYDQINPEGDFVIIHDPQPCPVIKHAKDRTGKWIWRCHIDTSNPNPQAWNLISEYLPMYDALIFTKKEFVKPGTHDLIFPITPSIDPFSIKNEPMSDDVAKGIVEKFIPTDLPIVTQVSRFDPWKDPLGVIDAYRIVSKEIPIRLVLVGSLAHDDPEGVKWLDKIKSYSAGDSNIHILTNLDSVADKEVNAFQRMSSVILQKSIREGFGLTVTEALWKKKPVIGGDVGGIQLQIENGVNGFLVNSVEETAEKMLYLLKNPKISEKMGENGREKVKENFLLIRHLEKYLDLFSLLSN